MTTHADAEIHRSWRLVFERLAEPKLAAMLFLGFCAGLPFYLVFGVLSTWLREAGFSRAEIGFFVWIGLFYTFKFAWAPLVDRVKLPGLEGLLGQRRAWIAVAQAGLVVGLIGAGASDPQNSLTTLALFILLVAFSSATQDIAVDAWRVEAAEDDTQAAFAAMYQAGYRFGLILAPMVAFGVSGALSPDLADGGEVYTPQAWTTAYWVMAALVVLGASTLLWAGEPRRMAQGATRWIDLSRWRRDAPLAGLTVLIVVATAVAVLLGLGAALQPLTAGFRVWANVLSATPTLVVAAICAAVIAAPFWLQGRQRGLTYAAVAAALFSAYVLAARLAMAYAAHLSRAEPSEGWRLALAQADPAVIAFGALPMWFAALPFVLTAVVVPYARKLPATSAWLNDPAFGAPLDFIRRMLWTALLVLAFVALYRISDFTMGVMANPLYVDLGYTKETVAMVKGVFGWATGLAGAFIGGLAALRFGLKSTLVVGAVITVLTNLAFAWLAAHEGAQTWRLFVAVGADNVAGGFAGGALIAYMSALTSTAFTASQYALFSSLYALYGKLLAGFSGVLADAVGWVNFFVITAGFGLPAIVLSLALFAVRTYERSHDDAPSAPPAGGAAPGESPAPAR